MSGSRQHRRPARNGTPRIPGRLGCVLLFAAFVSVAGDGAQALAQTRDLSRVRILAVAPFADDDPTTRPLRQQGAARLSDLLKGGPFQIIETARVAAEMGQTGVSAADLISPSRTVALGMQLGADAVLTGRVVQIFQDSDPAEEGGGTSIEGRVTIDVRILEVRTRFIVLQEEVRCTVPGRAADAMECVVREVAARLRQTRN